MKRLATLALAVIAALPAAAGPTSILFVGNSYTFGRVDPVMSYNAANVRDLTNIPNSGGNAFEPHPWGGIAGIFKQFTVQAGLDYDVAMSARNAASLRGHFLNTNGVVDLRSNIGSQRWDQMVLQEQSDEPLFRRPGLDASPEYFRMYADRIEDWVHNGAAQAYRERDYAGFTGTTNAQRNASCAAATGSTTGTCGTLREIAANANASAATQMFLYGTWARPNLVDGAFVTTTDPVTGAVTRTTTPATTFFSSLDEQTSELRQSFAAADAEAGADGTGGFAGIAPVGDAFLSAVIAGIATRDMWADDALTDGLMDLWFDDGTHASKYGSYLSALTLFGSITGVNPFSLGHNEVAARDLGISSSDAVALQRIAALQLGMDVPEPGSLSLVALAMLALLRPVSRSRTAGRTRH